MLFRSVGTMWFFSSCGGILVLRRGITGFLLCRPWVAQTSLRVRGKAGCCARITARPKRPHLGVCPGPNSPLKGRQGSRDCTPDSPGSQASPRGEAKDCALLSSREADLLEPTESPQGSPSYSSVWREDSGTCYLCILFIFY